MATLANNNVFFSLGGTNVSAYFTAETSRDVTVNQVEITAGAGVDWKLNAPGLFSYKMGLTLVYDVDTYQSTVRPLLQTGMETGLIAIYGPEGQTTGKPKDELMVNIESIKGPNISISKNMVTVELGLVNGNAAPVAVIELGGVFA